MPIAEGLCYPCLIDNTPSHLLKNNSGRYAKAWDFIDASLARGNNQGYSHLGKVPILLSHMSPDATPDKASRVMLLRAYLPALQDRSNAQPVSAEHKAFANKGFGEALRHCLAKYLMSRPSVATEDFLHPVSPREEASPAKQKKYNHDTYKLLYEDGDISAKYPLQIKLGRPNGIPSLDLEGSRNNYQNKYDVPVLSVYRTLVPVMEALSTNSLTPIMQFAVSENSTGDVGYYETTALDFASFSVQNAINDGQFRRLLAQTPKR